MKDAWFVTLCAITLFTIIEAKPWKRGSGHGNDDDDSYEGCGVGYGSDSYGVGGIGSGRHRFDDYSGNGYGGNTYRGIGSGSSSKGKGGGRYGSGPRRGAWKRHSSEELDDLSFLKPSCSGPGCSIVSIGNGHHNTNIVDLV